MEEASRLGIRGKQDKFNATTTVTLRVSPADLATLEAIRTEYATRTGIVLSRGCAVRAAMVVAAQDPEGLAMGAAKVLNRRVAGH